MLRRLKGHRDVILEAGGENCYPAKGVEQVSNLHVRYRTQIVVTTVINPGSQQSDYPD
jgi:hypothetical protein